VLIRLAVILAAAGLLAAPAHADGDFVPGRVLVRWRTPAVAQARVAAIHLGAALPSVVRTRALAADRLVLETTPTAAATRALIARLRADPDVLYAEPDYIRHRTGDAVTPSDPLYPKQWALPMIKAPQAWSRTTGSDAVTVAIIDTGAVPHPELTARITGGYDFITDAANAADGDGRDGDYTDTGDSSDESSALHGTHVAGIIAASSDNGVGVAGLDWGCRLVIVRALGVRRGTGVDSDISAAIRWAAGLHVDGVPDNPTPAAVINMSFGGAGYSQTMQDAVHAAVDAGAVVVAAAGNLSVDAKDDSPAGLDGVITVGAVDPTGTIAAYSNFGDVVALMAPGGSPARDPMTGQPEGVLSTIELADSGFTYTYLAGTSQAAPFVSAAVSLMKGLAPQLDAGDARRLLMQSADPSAQCRNPTDPTRPGCGAGLLDVDAAIVLAGQAALTGGVLDRHTGNLVHGGYGCDVGGGAPSAAGLALLGLALVALGLRRVL
jgi:serine protease